MPQPTEAASKVKRFTMLNCKLSALFTLSYGKLSVFQTSQSLTANTLVYLLHSDFLNGLF